MISHQFKDRRKGVANELWELAVQLKNQFVEKKYSLFNGLGISGLSVSEIQQGIDKARRLVEDNGVYFDGDFKLAFYELHRRAHLFLHSEKFLMPGDPVVREIKLLWRNFEKEIRKIISANRESSAINMGDIVYGDKVGRDKINQKVIQTIKNPDVSSKKWYEKFWFKIMIAPIIIGVIILGIGYLFGWT